MTPESVLCLEAESTGAITTPPSRLHRFFERQSSTTPCATALIHGGEQITYAGLDERANRLARHLIALGVRPGARIGLLLDRSINTYIALLAVLKGGAALVPMDPSYPPQRILFIAEDAGLDLVLTTSAFAAQLALLSCPTLELDRSAAATATFPSTRPNLAHDGDALAYVIYTSGSTGKPKGVAVNHSNICFFLDACTPVYAIAPDDRVYQGMTLAFDFSIEEIWTTFIAGATLIVGPTDTRRLGPGLANFLREQRATVLFCVPTLLATLDSYVPSLRMLVAGGEACPAELVDRWAPRVRRMLNTYGPTETTVTATWTDLVPDRKVTIGRPMPGYSVYVLNGDLEPAPAGEAGEICIGGPGVSQGYLNRPALTREKFIADPFEPGGRLYRTGDLGRIAPGGDIEFLGRMDTQVKVRGFRMELGEIEAVLLEDRAIQSAAVTIVAADVAAYITLRDPTADPGPLRQRLAERVANRLPTYMTPAWIEILESLPVLPSGKSDRARLPPPTSPRIVPDRGEYVPPSTDLEERIASIWRSAFGSDRISVEADFFLDLGGHSLFAAQTISRLREQPGMSHLGIADLYAHPTIRGLAGVAVREEQPCEPAAPPVQHSNARVWTAGLAQFALLYLLFAILAAPGAYVLAGPHSSIGVDLAIPPLTLLQALVLPIALKWTLVGRFRAGSYPLWGWNYCRLWIVGKALDLSPIHCLAGSPLLAVYARLLGARIGRNCHIATAHLNLPDLIDIGDGAHIGYDAELHTFSVEGGRVRLAPIHIGRDAFIGAKSVILAGARIGPEARIAEQSLVAQDTEVPAGESWGGSPLTECASSPILDDIERQSPAPDRIPAYLWAAYAAGFVVLEAIRFAAALPGLVLLVAVWRERGLLASILATPLAGLLFVLTTCLLVFAGKHLVLHRPRAGLYAANSWFGFRKWFADRLMSLSLTFTNSLYATLYTAPWLRALGARIGPRSEVSTVSHIDPSLLVLGSETFVADLASIGAAAFHRGYTALNSVEVGDRTFIGNAAVVRGGTALPDNCLIGVASVPPPRRPAAGSSWLGSPAMFLPKREVVDSFSGALTYWPTPRAIAYRLAIEFWRIVLPPALLYLLGASMAASCSAMLPHLPAWLIGMATPGLYFIAAFGITVIVAAMKWAIVGRYRPRREPLWASFVRHSELITGLYENAAVPALIGLAAGTPWAAPLLRLFGARIGRRVWIDTTYLTEFDLVRVGDDAAIGRATSLQTHLFEDRVMKMAAVEIGQGCAVGPRSVVLYGSKVSDGACLDGLSLVMKGESLPPATKWRGIPSRRVVSPTVKTGTDS